MAGSLNKVLLIGRLGADPEIKQMVNGKSVARLSLATSQSWKDKNTGEKKEKTEWHRIVVFDAEDLEPAWNDFEIGRASCRERV